MTAPFSLFEPVDADQLADDLVPGPIGGELLAQPVRQRRAVDHPALVAAADQQDRPLGREVLGEVGMLEQVLDQLAPLVAFPACPERPGPPARWESGRAGRGRRGAGTPRPMPAFAGLTPAFFQPSSISLSMKTELDPDALRLLWPNRHRPALRCHRDARRQRRSTRNPTPPVASSQPLRDATRVRRVSMDGLLRSNLRSVLSRSPDRVAAIDYEPRQLQLRFVTRCVEFCTKS